MLRFEKKTEYDFLAEAKELARDVGVCVRTAQLLLLRGITTAREAENFMHPLEFECHDPYLFNDMGLAVERIRAAIASKEKICVFGDYDADGVCATAIMMKTLKKLGADTFYYIPSRQDEGYGITLKAIDSIAKSNVKLIITVDNGVKAIAEAEYCKRLGIDLIVTDHHIADDMLPDCCAVICHTARNCNYPNKNICGAGTALKLCQAMAGDAVLEYGIELAGIATVTDIIPLAGENKAFVAQALRHINSGKASLGIETLLNKANKKKRKLTTYDFGFVIGPRLNAAGRIENADIAVKLLLSNDRLEAEELAQKLDELNNCRKQEERDIYSDVNAELEAANLTDARTIVLKSMLWNPGVIGVAASRVADKYTRPTILFTERDGVLTGSGRSIRGVSLYDALEDNKELFSRFGGHSFAAGITMPAENFEAFREEFERSVKKRSDEKDFIPRQTYELELDISELNKQFAQELELMAPFGEENPAPLFLLRDVMLKKLKVYGTETTHLSFSVVKDNIYHDAFYPFAGDKISEILDYSFCDILYSYEINSFMDKKSTRMVVKNIKRADTGEPAQYAANCSAKFYGAIYQNIRYNNSRVSCEASYVDTDERVLDLFENRIAGTAVLVFTVLGAERFLRLAQANALYKRFELEFYKNRHNVCAYNTVIFAPIIDELELGRFKNIIVYDTPITFGILDKLSSMFPALAIEVDNRAYIDAEKEVAMLNPEREQIKAIYLALRRLGGSFYNRSNLIDSLRSATAKADCVIELAIDIFIELNFLSVEGNRLTFVKDAPFKNLNESFTYQTASALNEMYNAYIKARRNTNGS